MGGLRGQWTGNCRPGGVARRQAALELSSPFQAAHFEARGFSSTKSHYLCLSCSFRNKKAVPDTRP